MGIAWKRGNEAALFYPGTWNSVWIDCNLIQVTNQCWRFQSSHLLRLSFYSQGQRYPCCFCASALKAWIVCAILCGLIKIREILMSEHIQRSAQWRNNQTRDREHIGNLNDLCTALQKNKTTTTTKKMKTWDLWLGLSLLSHGEDFSSRHGGEIWLNQNDTLVKVTTHLHKCSSKEWEMVWWSGVTVITLKLIIFLW